LHCSRVRSLHSSGAPSRSPAAGPHAGPLWITNPGVELITCLLITVAGSYNTLYTYTMYISIRTADKAAAKLRSGFCVNEEP
jgi:hypothetical protein